MTGRGLVRYFGFVGLAYVVATLGTGLTDYLTAAEVSRSKALLISGGVGLLVALLLGAIDLAKSNAGKSATPAAVGAYPATPGGGGTPGHGGPAPVGYGGTPAPGGVHGGYPAGAAAARPASGATPPRRGGAGLVLTAVLLLGLCAGGGYLATTAMQAAVQQLNEFATPPWIKKGQETGQERLAEEVSETGGPLTITVLSVEVTSQATKVKIRGVNSGGDALTLPVFGRAQLTAPGRTLQPDPAAGDWPQTVPADGEATGTIVFDGVLGPEVTEVRLSFSVIHGSFDAPPNIAVTIPLT
ncbi:hypothetical protein [Catellatospora bangladeshensis]|uniref:DUF4352 domain-containing protein n=1 Tax=Catellatospora bangladeshensis TaxID=310355 RepID=A0A8J3JHV9_9ACTN|nr:hypothetical protein [Catellatospora bangladeshensis]GIF79290.1 hypothetical protein Cba03nite_06390 [Catellatospora bangladeshensis]